MSVRHWVSDDEGYTTWVQNHPSGYVVNLSKRTFISTDYLSIHRASHRLPNRSNPESVNPWTGNGYTKATSESLEPLLEWITAHGFVIEEKHYCKICNLLSKPSKSNESKSLPSVDERHLPRSLNLAESAIETEVAFDKANDFDPHSIEDARKWINASIVRRQGQGKFRADVLAAYGKRCAISACDVPEALEAAHIFRYMGAETNVVTNGLLLRSDLHTLYDLGLIAIDPASMKIIIAPKLKNSDYEDLAEAMVRLPLKAEQRPSYMALEMHATWAKSTWQ